MFDLTLFAFLVLPLAVVAALASGRTKAAVIYTGILVSLCLLALAVKAVARVSVRDYLDSIRTSS